MSDSIAEYLDELRRELRCSRRRKVLILAEVRDHLHEAAAAAERNGADRTAAETIAVQQFGRATVFGRKFTPNAELWTALGFYLHAGMFMGVLVFATGLNWCLAAIFNNWLIGTPWEGNSSVATTGMQVALLGLAIGAAHLFLRIVLLEDEDVAVAARWLRSGGGWLLLALGIGCLLYGGYGMIRAETTSIHTLTRDGIAIGITFVVVGSALRWLPSPRANRAIGTTLGVTGLLLFLRAAERADGGAGLLALSREGFVFGLTFVVLSVVLIALPVNGRTVGRGLAISISGPAILYLAHAIRIAVERQSLDDVVIRNGLAGFALIALAVGVALVPGRLQNSVRTGRGILSCQD